MATTVFLLVLDREGCWLTQGTCLMVQDLVRSASTPLGLCESYAPVLHVGYVFCSAVGTEVMLD